MTYRSFYALILGSLLLTSSAQAMNRQEEAPAAAAAAVPVRTPQEPVGDGNSVNRDVYLKAEGRFREWERGARKHDLTRFIEAIANSSLTEQEQDQV
jgi:hypothetical protein